MKFGVIGYGSFGKLLAEVLAKHGEVMVYSRNEKEKPAWDNVSFASFEDTAKADIVILAIGLESLDNVSKRLAGLVHKKTVVVDVCSVKQKPIEILTKNLAGKCRILPTHPLFGPYTVKDGSFADKKMVLCPFDFKGRDKIMDFLKNKLELDVIEMSAEDHDREMAWVHGLTFFVGRGLMKLNPPKGGLTTGYYQKLLDLVELESTHSIELFNTVQRGNPFASEIRQRLIKELEEIDREIED